MVYEICGYLKGVIGTKKLPADSTLNNMKKTDVIELLHIAQHNYESLLWSYKNAVDNSKCNICPLPTKWIPCNERLPELWESVLVCFKTQDGMAQTVSERFEKDRWSALCGLKPIAWMPLPEPYKEGVE